MLRHDVVDACREGKFSIYPVRHVSEALELYSGLALGVKDPEHGFGEGTLLGIAAERATEFWLKTLQSPSSLFELVDDEEEASVNETEEG